ncbi:DUF1343 domain-containing protein [Prolixibacteraceae bacterium JC049]|nr:DUF1343 domain-containing protein [Prolixibacteraceae bacterium JC049]
MKRVLLILSVLLFPTILLAQTIKVGAEKWENYQPLIQGKKIGLIVNQTSTIGKQHIVDFLLSKQVEITKIFAPEHGFRGDHGAGEKVSSSKDPSTGIPIVSIYGKNKKPQKSQLQDIEVMIFDIQDVGCRFYTYISTMHLAMEACAENNIPFIVLDRPNPNGDYIAGPVLKMQNKSFVGMHPIPVVHGCTVGELAQMINGEKWLKDGVQCDLTIIEVDNYTHAMPYSLPIAPSPNLPNDKSIRLYPSLCFFEATSVSVGRGTDFPFQIAGFPSDTMGTFSFTPRSIPNAAPNPLHKGKKCYGIDYRTLDSIPHFSMQFFVDFYNKFAEKSQFLTRPKWLIKLYGTQEILPLVYGQANAEAIEKTWQNDLQTYANMRKKYLLYPDFE